VQGRRRAALEQGATVQTVGKKGKEREKKKREKEKGNKEKEKGGKRKKRRRKNWEKLGKTREN
jgi:hypothetical protein